MFGIFFSYEENSIDRNRPFYLFVLPGSLFLIAISSSVAFGLSYLDLVIKTWKEFSDTFGSEKHPLIWLLLIVGALGIAIWSDFGRGKWRSAFASSSLAISFLILPLLNFAWIGYDSSQTDAPTYTKQLFRQFIGEDVCDDPFFVTGVTPLKMSSIPVPVLPLMMLGGYPRVGRLQEPPVRFGVDIWGTEISDPLNSFPVTQSKSQIDAMVGEFAAPSFAIDSAEYVGVVISAGDRESTKFSMQFFDQIGKQLESRELRTAGVSEWEPLYVKVPAGARAVRMVISDNGSTFGAWGASSAIFKADFASQNEIAETGNFFIGSFENQKYSCIELARPQGGVWPHFRYVTQEDSFFQPVTFGADIPLESELCGLGDLTCFRTPLYGTAEPKRIDR